MKYLLFTFLTLVFSSGLFAQKVINDAHAEVRSVPSFHAIHVSHAFDVLITQGNTESVAVSASEKEDVAGITTEVHNGILKIGFKSDKKWLSKNRKLRAYISVTNLDELKGGGATNIKIEGTLAASNLKLNMSGASDLKGRITVNGKLDIDLSGASDITLEGSADEVAIEASGASDIKAYDFTARNCTVAASGACTVRITVEKELSAKLSGASNISYKGSALIRDIKTSGASNISRKS